MSYSTLPLDVSVWYEIQASRKGDGDWNSCGVTRDSVDAAKAYIDFQFPAVKDRWEFRIIKKTLTEEVLSD